MPIWRDRRATADVDCPQDNTTAILQHLFPSPGGGELRISSAKTDLFTSMNIEQVGKLLNAYTQYKKDRNEQEIVNALDGIVAAYRKSTREDISKNWGLGKSGFKDLIKIYTNMFMGALDEEKNYPFALVESALLAFAIKKAGSADELLLLLNHLAPYQNQAVTLTSYSKADYEEFKKINLENNRIPTDSFSKLLDRPEYLIFNTLACDRYDDTSPPVIDPGTAQITHKFFQIS